ncbi:hypothetical protein CHS0354_002840 [Potamilus streckersoni]|uniref:Uncharacterized protein n=1 Tax=Potamilus streckersoni TaxID=2493646 RepID=A0AAE0RMK3_9BIVA|nr:hypothetical protein CHS0354_002840 [Potamilus streckersoni]
MLKYTTSGDQEWEYLYDYTITAHKPAEPNSDDEQSPSQPSQSISTVFVVSTIIGPACLSTLDSTFAWTARLTTKH